MMLVTWLLGLGGLSWMALSMPKHYRQARPDAGVPHVTGARTAAWLLLGLSLVPSLSGASAATGVVAWLGLLTISAVSVTLLLTHRPRATGLVAYAAPLVAAVVFVYVSI